MYNDINIAKEHSTSLIYDLVKSYLDNKVEQYSKVEIAFWPMLVNDMLTYQSTGTVGAFLGSYVNRGHLTATEICTAFLPKLQYQEAILTLRDNASADIKSKETIEEVEEALAYHTALIQGL